MPELATETRKLARNSALYLIPNLLVRGISFFMTPVYARFMTPDDYGIVGVCTTVNALTALIVGLCIPAAVARMHFELQDEEERRRFNGAMFSFLLIGPPLVVVLIDVLGRLGPLDVMKQVPFVPYVELAVWSGYFAFVPSVPGALLAAREEAGKVAVFNTVQALLQIGATILFVVTLRQGALGVLRAQLASGAVTTVIGLALMWPMSDVGIRWEPVKRAVALGAPLVLHLGSHWVLNLADRMILERYVPAADVGLYSIAYLFALAVMLVSNSILDVLAPMVLRLLKEDVDSPVVPRLGSLVIGAICFFSLGAAVIAPDVLRLLFPPAYLGAAPAAPWVIAGAAMQGLYLVWSQGTWFVMKTRRIAIVTLIAAVANVALNLLFVPRFGMLGAAVLTFVTYALLAVMHGAAAALSHRIAWSYREWVAAFAAALGAYFVCVGVTRVVTPSVALFVKLAISTIAFPAALVALGVVRRENVRSLLRRG